MLVDAGYDFSEEMKTRLLVYDDHPTTAEEEEERTSMFVFRHRDGLTTRARNIYKGEKRGFEYLSPRLRLEVADLLSVYAGDLPRWIHMVCSPDRAAQILKDIDHHLSSSSNPTAPPQLVYEPIPDSCTPSNLSACLALLPRLAVFSPNHEEAANLLSQSTSWAHISMMTKNEAEQLEWIVTHLLHPLVSAARKAGGKTLVVIRCGHLGCVLVPPTKEEEGGGGKEEVVHVPPYHSGEEQEEVRDVTGAGNAFLGGLTAFLARHAAAKQQRQRQQKTPSTEILLTDKTDDDEDEETTPTKQTYIDAAIHGAVGASFVVEQLGLPSFQCDRSGSGDGGGGGGGGERWNGTSVEERVGRLRARVDALRT